MKVDWNRITSSLGLKGQTAASLQAFKKRNDDARRRVNNLSALPQTVDFQAYRDQLKNTTVVDNIEKEMKNFSPRTYDVNKQIKAIETFEVQAVKSAEETKEKVDEELKSLHATLDNIDKTRRWEDITTDDVFAAKPGWEKRFEKMMEKGIWMPPGYKEKFGDLSVM
ncbi:ATP synthase d subunit [Bacidia gigantensis]|uniref:ATP synthase d subunit n=1 Tax=Bacidia gigantensis TaxID=2732470 RepID=UPI001D058124|nr:ATP synthase d subunit [Bacidia gigantensis]KAG8528743.1 ATP synthase d subunit [Bacidia gigantensis]